MSRLAAATCWIADARFTKAWSYRTSMGSLQCFLWTRLSIDGVSPSWPSRIDGPDAWWSMEMNQPSWKFCDDLIRLIGSCPDHEDRLRIAHSNLVCQWKRTYCVSCWSCVHPKVPRFPVSWVVNTHINNHKHACILHENVVHVHLSNALLIWTACSGGMKRYESDVNNVSNNVRVLLLLAPPSREPLTPQFSWRQ